MSRRTQPCFSSRATRLVIAPAVTCEPRSRAPALSRCPGAKPLHDRAWQCPACRAWLDRDINAAVNVAKAAGLAVQPVERR
jgi:hypothetical protein